MRKVILTENDISLMVREAVVEAKASEFYKKVSNSPEVHRLLESKEEVNENFWKKSWNLFKNIGTAGTIMTVLNNLIDKLKIDKTKPFYKFITSKVVLGIISYKIAASINNSANNQQQPQQGAIQENVNEITNGGIGAIGGGLTGAILGVLLREVLGIPKDSLLYNLLNPVLMGGAGAGLGAAIGSNQQEGGLIDKFRNSGVGNMLGLNQQAAPGMNNAPAVNYTANNTTYPTNPAYTTTTTQQQNVPPQNQQPNQQQISEAIDNVFEKYFK